MKNITNKETSSKKHTKATGLEYFDTSDSERKGNASRPEIILNGSFVLKVKDCCPRG